jgi:putative ABC transport system substrate-binding protein
MLTHRRTGAWVLALLMIGYLLCLSTSGWPQDKVYRLGVPKGHTTPFYEQLFAALEKKGFVIGNNLKIVPIALDDFQSASGAETIRREIAQQCDLFFTTGDDLKIILDLAIQSPLLFIGITGPQHRLPGSMQANATGVYRCSAVAIFKQSLQMLPTERRRKLGLIYFRGSQMATLAPQYQELCKELDTVLVVKDYGAKEDIGRVMGEFKAEGVGGVLLFPPAIRSDELTEVITWQNRLKLPVIGQVRSEIEQGLVGGPAMDFNVLVPILADYAAKILRGRQPGQLPIRYYSSDYLINLATVSALGIDIPSEVIDQAEIVGFTVGKRKRRGENGTHELVAGNYVIGVPKYETPSTTLAPVIRALAARGYVEGKNLHFVQIDLSQHGDPHKQQRIAARIAAETNLFFATGKELPLLIQLQGLATPVCFIATKETAAVIPAHLKNNFTGVVRASFGSIIAMSQRMMQGAKRMAILARADTGLQQSAARYRRTAAKYGVSLDFRPIYATDEIGPAMQELQRNNDFIMLFPSSVTPADLAAIVTWQNRLRFPVLAQSQSYIEAGLLGGPVIDLEKVAPKLAEYMDKLLQGRDPAKLPIYYYPEEYVINLRAASILRQEIPADITIQAEIIR